MAAVSIPVLIHLFNFRKHKRVYFSNVRFLRDIQLESKSKSRLREIILLILRSLAIACLVLAFAQPFIPVEQSSSKRSASNQVSVYIDNSFSMENVSSQGPLLQVAVQHARELAGALSSNTWFQLITNDFEGKHQRLYSKEDFLRLLDDVKISPAPRRISEVLKRQTLFLQGSGPANKKVYAFTDLQTSNFDLDQFVPDSLIQYHLLPLTANKVNNVSLDSCWFDTPIQQNGLVQRLHARIRNHGDQEIELGSARLTLNQQQIAIASFSLESGAQTDVQFSIAKLGKGFNYGAIKIEDYPVTFDDELFFAFNSELNLRVLLINGIDQNSAKAFNSLFQSDSLFQFRSTTEQSINFAAFKTSEVILLNGLTEISSGLQAELLNFSRKGGVVVLIPPDKCDLKNYNLALQSFHLPALAALDTSAQRTEQLQYASGFYEGVFDRKEERMNMPMVAQHYKIAANAADAEVLMRVQNGDPFFMRKKYEQAQFYLFASSFSERAGNFTKHALFVPSVYKMCLSSLQSPALFYTAGANVALPFRADSSLGDEPPHILNTNGKSDIIPEMRKSNGSNLLFTRSQINDPGYYVLTSRSRSITPLAFNYSRQESDLRALDKSELEVLISRHNWQNVKIIDTNSDSIARTVALETEGKKLWKLFLILSIVFMALEVAVLRLLK
jgi:hypothetical protein